MKRLALLLALFMTVICMCSCRNRLTSMTSSEMKDYLVRNDYWDDKKMISASLGEYSSVGGVFNDDLTLTFMDYGDEKKSMDDMIEIFLKNIDYNVREKKSNYVIYEYETEQNYNLYVRVDNTFVMLNGPKSKRNDIIELAGDMGYFPEKE